MTPNSRDLRKILYTFVSMLLKYITYILNHENLRTKGFMVVAESFGMIWALEILIAVFQVDRQYFILN